MADKTIALEIIIEADKANSVDELTASIKQLETELGKSKKGSKQFNDLQASITKTKGKLDNTTKSMGKLNTATKGVSKASKTMEQGFSGATSVLGLFGNVGIQVQSRIMGIQNAVKGLNFGSIKTGISNFAGLIKGIRTGAGALKVFKLALISTGIGALLAAMGGLVAYFTKTQEGADKLRVVMAQVGSVVGNIVDRLVKYAKGIAALFSGDIIKGLKMIKESFTGIGKEIKDDLILAGKLERQLIQMEVTEKRFQLQRAKANKEIAKAEAIYNDETKSIKERRDAMKMAMSVERAMMAGETANLKIRIQNKEAELGINESMRTDNFELIDLRIRMENLKKSSFNTEKRLQSQLTGLDRKATSEGKASLKAKQDIEKGKQEAKQETADFIKDLQRKRQLLTASDRSKELLELKNEYEDNKALYVGKENALIELKKNYDLQYKLTLKKFAEENKVEQKKKDDETIAAEKALQVKITEAGKKGKEDRAKQDAKELELAKRHQAAKEELIQGGINTAFDLARMFADGQDANSRKAFETNKALNIAEATISTITSAQKAYQSQLSIPTPDAPIRAAVAAGIATAAGLARIAAISRTKFNSPTTNVPNPSGGSIPTGNNNVIDPTRFGSTIISSGGRRSNNPVIVKNIISVEDINKANSGLGKTQAKSVIK